MNDAPFDVQKILTGLGYEVHAYSGRLMEGKYCIAIHSDELQHDSYMMSRVSDLIRDRYKLPFHKALSVLIDQLGKGHVIYFPDIPFSDGDEKE